MKKDLYIALSVLSFCFATVAVFQMVWKNRMPGTFGCEGRILDQRKVYLISNRKIAGPDTVLIHFTEPGLVMPEHLALIRFDPRTRGFIVVLSPKLNQGSATDTVMPLRPFAHTYTHTLWHPGYFFKPGQTIGQPELLRHGIKFNLPFGDRSTRVKLIFRQTRFGVLLQTADDGMDVSYTLKSDLTNRFDIFINQPPESRVPCVFSFTNRESAAPHYWQVRIDTRLLAADYHITDSDGQEHLGTGAQADFMLGDYLFAIQYHYGLWFSAGVVAALLALLCFQFYLLFLLWAAETPIIRSLMALRILLNIVACLAMPLFLSSYYQAPGRIWYLVLLIILNLSVFLPKDLFRKRKLARNQFTVVLAAVIILIAPFFFRFRTYNESLFGIIPILHCQKAVILLLFFVTRNRFFEGSYRRYFLRMGLILAYVLMISLLTHDIGSFIYTLLAVTVVELVRKTLSVKQFLTGLAVLVLAVTTLYLIDPQLTHERKFYRLVAPFQRPDASSLSEANEADRESFSTFNLDLKNIQLMQVPLLGDLVMPASQRSTAHSDFAFLSSMLYGGIYFFVFYILTTFLLVKNLFVLLFCATRECRINETQSYTFPKSPASELIRVLLAFTLVSFTFPVLSNLLLVPLTGQSIPILSISVIEPIFLIMLIVPLENIFNDTRFFAYKPDFRYTYSDLNKSLQFGMIKLAGLFIIVLALKNAQVFFATDAYNWSKVHQTDKHALLSGLPEAGKKTAIIRTARAYFRTETETPEDEQRRRLALLNLASLYYRQKPYSELFYESKTFGNSCKKLAFVMNIDSIRQDKARLISGPESPYGQVYSFNQLINNKAVRKVTQPYYQTVPPGTTSVMPDLTAELNEKLEAQLKQIGVPANFGAILVIDNSNGQILANSAYPFNDSRPASTRYYLPGSLKKLLIAYAALKLYPSYRDSTYGGVGFQKFLEYSNDAYPAALLKNLLLHQREEFSDLLAKDFDLPLISATNDAYLDAYPPAKDFNTPLDRHNSIYRLSIGQQRPYQFLEVMQWYARFAARRRLVLNFGESGSAEPLSIGREEDEYLHSSMNSVLNGTALNVKFALNRLAIAPDQFICKTGTAAAGDGRFNRSSSFIIANEQYTIGIMMSGTLPGNNGRLTSKYLFEKLLPVLLKYGILKTGPAKPEQQLALNAPPASH